MKSCKYCKHNIECEQTKSDRTVCTDGTWEYFESLPPLNIFEINNQAEVNIHLIKHLKEELDCCNKIIESMKCCGNCKHSKYGYVCYPENDDIFDCLNNSRWEPRELV